MRVFELGDVVLLDVPGGTKDELLVKLDQMLFSEDVQIGDVSGGFGCISVQGPLAPGVVAATLGLEAHDLGSWVPWRNARATWGGETVILARADEFGLPGFLLFCAMGAVPALAAATGRQGAVVVEPDTAAVLRIEAGAPEFLVDMAADTIPIEAGLEGSAISYSKGCFPGQEVLVRIRDRGHGRVARKLVGLAIDGVDVPPAGAEVFNGDKAVGQVTSAVHSHALGRPVALAYVHRDSIEPGTALSVAVGGRTAPAVVAALPLVP
jgi:folate-binding protein YgfZ